MNNIYIPTPKVSTKCDWCKKGKKYKFLTIKDLRKVTPDVKVICRKCYDAKAYESK